jgi:thiosulfate sulfurtransferase
MPTEITPQEYQQRRQNGKNVQLIDIRDTEAYEEGHIPEADNIPLEELGDRAEEKEWVTDEGDEIVVACYIGETSVQAARMLEAYEGTGNATVSTMAGGYEDWSGDLKAEK